MKQEKEHTFKLDQWDDFINRHFLNPIGIDYIDLLERGLAYQVNKTDDGQPINMTFGLETTGLD